LQSREEIYVYQPVRSVGVEVFRNGSSGIDKSRPLPTTKSTKIRNISSANSITMPKSKRAKLVTLSKVDKKRKEGSLKLFTNVREAVDKYQNCFVFSVENMRNTYLKTLRSEFSSDSRFVLGRKGLP
jgi:Ribosomal protein L10